MKKLNLIVAIVLLFTALSCEEDIPPQPAPEASFWALETNIIAGEDIYFSCMSSNEPTEWEWYFPGGSPSYSSDESPIVHYYEPGEYSVSLTVSNSGGSDYLEKHAFITVEPATVNLTFYNPTYTVIYLTVNYDNIEVWPGMSETLYGLNPGDYIDIYGYTSGETNQGTQVGLELSWSDAFYMGEVNHEITLEVDSDYFFLYLTSNGADLYPIYVNYGLMSETVDNVRVIGDGVERKLGYYRAFSNGNVRAYNANGNGYYVYWDCGYNYYLPWTANQSISLTNNVMNMHPGVTSASTNNHAPLLPESAEKNSIEIPENAVKLYAKEILE